eukprot:Lankesteria_metandrocarpae@DN3259_c0_g1_i1.p1
MWDNAVVHTNGTLVDHRIILIYWLKFNPTPSNTPPDYSIINIIYNMHTYASFGIVSFRIILDRPLTTPSPLSVHGRLTPFHSGATQHLAPSFSMHCKFNSCKNSGASAITLRTNRVSTIRINDVTVIKPTVKTSTIDKSVNLLQTSIIII